MNWLLLSAAVIGIGAVAARRYAPWLEQMLRAKLESSPRRPVLREVTALDHMIETLRREKDPLERHRLLSRIVEESYRQRTDAAMKKLFLRFAGMHLKELPQMAAALKAALGGKLPAVPAFELLAMELEENDRKEEAASVRKQAEELGLIDRLPAKAAGRAKKPERKIRKARPPVKRPVRTSANARGKRQP
jgi:hypothetical protein